MKTYTTYEDLPSFAHYLGSENGDGSMQEAVANAIDFAIEPVRLKEQDGTYSYFDLGNA